jgi:hypothetical protein
MNPETNQNPNPFANQTGDQPPEQTNSQFTVPTINQMPPPTPAPEKKPKKRRWLLWILLIFAMAIIGAVVTLFVIVLSNRVTDKNFTEARNAAQQVMTVAQTNESCVKMPTMYNTATLSSNNTRDFDQLKRDIEACNAAVNEAIEALGKTKAVRKNEATAANFAAVTEAQKAEDQKVKYFLSVMPLVVTVRALIGDIIATERGETEKASGIAERLKSATGDLESFQSDNKDLADWAQKMATATDEYEKCWSPNQACKTSEITNGFINTYYELGDVPDLRLKNRDDFFGRVMNLLTPLEKQVIMRAGK